MQFWFPDIVNRISNAGNSSSATVCDILDNSESENSTEMETAVNYLFNCLLSNQNTLCYICTYVCILFQMCSDHISNKTYIDNLVVGVAFLIGFSIQGFLLNPIGRKNVLLAALILSTISGIFLHLVSNSTVVLILFCLYILLPGLSISIMLGAIVDLMPTHLR